ncbi:MAG: hypothetical protein LAT77_09245 [Aliidiomarina sp.]|uniref:hypothetical protein n=1 Tax=Aliidiomarina sp. TaxID=1872439 RepID=UPI0025BED1D4|nr:hypothetical protein [Aliidiomarina sp.]MCH8502081.1 hypothetical protein [Aliidiomarina sp.]
MNKDVGQALLEMTLAISLLAMLALYGLPLLDESLQQRWRGQQLLPIILADAPLRESAQLPPLTLSDYQETFEIPLDGDYQLALEQSRAYPFAQAIQPIWQLISWQSNFSLTTDNLATATLQHQTSEQPWLRYSRLHHAWAPRSLAELSSRPQALTSSHYLNQLGFQHIQPLLALLPFAREFAPQQLRLAHIDIDVVPAHALCRGSALTC